MMKKFLRRALNRFQQSRKLSLLQKNGVTVGKDFVIGLNSVVWAPRKLVLGNNVAIGSNCRIEVDGYVGDHVLIANSAGIVGKSDHDFQIVGTSVRTSPWLKSNPETYSLSTKIGSDVWIGYGAIILSGIRIGSSSVIAAGSVVTHDVPPNSIFAGVPARRLRDRYHPSELARHWELLARSGVRIPEVDNYFDELVEPILRSSKGNIN